VPPTSAGGLTDPYVALSVLSGVAALVLAAITWTRRDADGASLNLSLPSDLQIAAEPALTRTVLENLVQNAVDHTDPPVTVTVGRLDADDGFDGFYVEDDGRGIPPEKRARIFVYGYTTGDDGTGFGLTIVREGVEAHGWAIKATEGTDGGARFEISGVNRAE
jgi:signal transduction histidine kinase